MQRPLLLSFLTVLLAAGAVLAQDRHEGALRPGSLATDFTLEPRGGGAPVTLSSFRGKSPVALVFGSYT